MVSYAQEPRVSEYIGCGIGNLGFGAEDVAEEEEEADMVVVRRCRDFAC